MSWFRPTPPPPTLEEVMAQWQDRPMFKGKNKEKADAWLEAFEAGCTAHKLERCHWVEAAKQCMAEEPKARLEEVRTTMEQFKLPKFQWDWDTYKLAVQNIPWHMGRKSLNFEDFRQLVGKWKSKLQRNPSSSTPQPEPKADVKEEPSGPTGAQAALSCIPVLGLWLTADLPPTPPPEPATPPKGKAAVTKDAKAKDTPRPQLKESGSSNSVIRQLSFLKKEPTIKQTPAEIRQSAIDVLLGKGSREDKQRAVQRFLATIEHWLAIACQALLAFYDNCSTLLDFVQRFLEVLSGVPVPYPCKEYVEAGHVFLVGVRDKIESIRPQGTQPAPKLVKAT